MPRHFTLCLALIAASPAAADFAAVSTRVDFVALMDGKELRDPFLGISLKVNPDGMIEGSAVRWSITGSWSWEDGFFCREMDWSGMAIEYNCQLVEVDGNRMRFTVDQGNGDTATFTLR